jgi:hypothetical protein
MHDDDTHDLRVSARTARLTASTDDNGPPYTFSGISVAAGDVLHMDDGTRVLFTADELRKAAETQAGEPLSVDHPTDEDGQPIYPPPTEESPGKVPKAGWLEDQQAVGYEATTHDENIAVGVQAGSYEVSVHPQFALGEYVEDRDAYRATNIKFRDLSVVSKGDSPSNTAEWGPNQALASYTITADIGAELDAAASADGGGDTPQQSLVSSAVRGTLRALGIDTDAVADDAPTLTAQLSDEAAESATDTGSSSSSDTPMDRDSTIDTLADEHGLSRDALSDMDEGDLETLTKQFGDGGTDTPDDPSGGTDGGGQTLADMTVDDLATSLENHGFVTEESVDEAIASAQSQTEKAEKVDELIAKSDSHDEDDREELMASSEPLIDAALKQARGQTAASVPGVAGISSSLTADASDSDDDLDAYGTGVQED